jgi:hypothetical protein
MRIALFMALCFLVSCGTIKEFIKKGETHQKMAHRLDSEPYEMSVAALKEKLIASFDKDDDAPMIMMPMDSSERGTLEQQQDRRKAIEDALDDQGFSYKSAMYKNDLDVNWMGLWKNHEKELAKVKSKIKTGPYHTVEDSKDMFLIVKGINVYKGEAQGPGKSKLSISELKELKRDPMQINLAWFQIFKTGKLWFSLNEGPVSLEKSLATAKRNRLQELTLLHYMDKDKFVAWESEASK